MIKDVKKFTDICIYYHGAYIDMIQSILGIFILNLLEPVKIIISSENDNSKIGLYNSIKKWKI